MSAPSCFARQLGLITARQQLRLSQARVAIFGLGGVGGLCAELVARAGVGDLMVVDFDRFERTNFNRQIQATRRTLGKKKADVFAAHALAVNPKIKIKRISRKLGYASLSFFARSLSSFSPSIVIDTMDNIGSRVLLARACKRAGIPYLYAAASGGRGMVGVVEGKADLEKIVHLPSLGLPDAQVESSLIHYPQCRQAWGPATNLAGALAANAALNYLLKKPYPKAPEFWMTDAFDEKIVRQERLG